MMGTYISTTEYAQHHYCPIPDDVFAVRKSLMTFVPMELADLILDKAKYWPKGTCHFKPENPFVLSGGRRHNSTVCCLLTPKLCELPHNGISMGGAVKVKVVRFHIVSHDQGWCDANNFSRPYEGSHTWFEALIVRDFIHRDVTTACSNDEIERIQYALNLRFDDAKDPSCQVVTVKTPNNENSDVWTIQRNKRASGNSQVHTVVWTEEEGAADERMLMDATGQGLGRGFLKALKRDDRIAVMARAQYPAWTNHIISVELEIYYSV